MKIKFTEKYGIELRYWVVAIILFSVVFAFMIIAFHDAAAGYDVEGITNPDIESRYDRLSEQESLVGKLQETTSGEEGFRLFNTLGTIFTATIGVLNLVLASVSFIPNVFSNFASDFGIPTQITNLFFIGVTLILTTLIIFAILNAIKR